MSAPTSRPAVVVVGPKSEFSVDDQLEVARRSRRVSRSSSSGMMPAHRHAGHDADAPAVEARQRVESLRARASAARPRRRRRSRSAGSRRSSRRRAARARRADRARRSRRPTSRRAPSRARAAHRSTCAQQRLAPSSRSIDLPGVEVRELRQADGNDRDRQHGVAERPEVGERLLEHVAVVQPGHDHHLAVELNAALGEPRELLDDVRHARVVEQHLARFPRRGVHRDVERRQPVLEDARDVALLEVRQRREVPVGEREPVVVVANVERLAEALAAAPR